MTPATPPRTPYSATWGQTSTRRDPISELTADDLEVIFHAALTARDVEGVGHVLRAMLSLDPCRALRLHDDLRIALAVAPFIEETSDRHRARACERPPGRHAGDAPAR
jgi:hypothetical protein